MISRTYEKTIAFSRCGKLKKIQMSDSMNYSNMCFVFSKISYIKSCIFHNTCMQIINLTYRLGNGEYLMKTLLMY